MEPIEWLMTFPDGGLVWLDEVNYFYEFDKGDVGHYCRSAISMYRWLEQSNKEYGLGTHGENKHLRDLRRQMMKKEIRYGLHPAQSPPPEAPARATS